jgi:hypothetical protein
MNVLLENYNALYFNKIDKSKEISHNGDIGNGKSNLGKSAVNFGQASNIVGIEKTLGGRPC